MPPLRSESIVSRRARAILVAALFTVATAEAAEPTPAATPAAEPTGGQASPGAPAPVRTLTLADALRLVDEQHPELRAAAERVKASEAAAAAEWSIFIPRLVIDGGVVHDAQPSVGPVISYLYPDGRVDTQGVTAGAGVLGLLPTGTTYQLRLDNDALFTEDVGAALAPRYEPRLRLRVEQPLLLGLWPSRTMAAIRTADARVTVMNAAAAARRDALYRRIAGTWLDAARAARVVALRASAVKLAESFQRLTQQLIDGGQLSRLELAIAEQTVAQRNVELSAAVADREAALGRLVEELRVPMDAASVEVAPLNPWRAPGVARDAAKARARERSPALLALDAEIARAETEREAVALDGLPELSVGLEGSVGGLAGESRCHGGTLPNQLGPCLVDPALHGGYEKALLNVGRSWSVGVVVSGSTPLWPGTEGNRETARRHEVEALRFERTATEAMIDNRIARLLNDVEQRGTVLGAAAEAKRLAAVALDAEGRKLRGGRSTVFDLLQAQVLVTQAELQEVEAQYQAMRTALELRAELGQLSPEHAALFQPATPSVGSASSDAKTASEADGADSGADDTDAEDSAKADEEDDDEEPDGADVDAADATDDKPPAASVKKRRGGKRSRGRRR